LLARFFDGEFEATFMRTVPLERPLGIERRADVVVLTEGEQILAGRSSPTDPVAAPWIPERSLAENSGDVRLEHCWAALDCPGYFAIGDGEVAVLGRIAGHVGRLARVGERCVVTGWPIGKQGRKLFAGTALFAEGRLCG
jgi:hypothetical protein